MNPAVVILPPRVLVIDDTVQIHGDFVKILNPPATGSDSAFLAANTRLFGDASPPASARFEVDCASQGEEGLARVVQALAENRPYAVAFVDMRMPPGWDGLETIRQLWAADPALQVVICTAFSDHSWSQLVKGIGQTDNLLILRKPFENIEVLQLAHALARKWEITRRDRELLVNLDAAVRERTAELREAEARFTRAFEANPMPQAIQDLETGRIIEVNTAHVKFSGMTRAQILGATPETFGQGLDPQRWRGLIASLRAGQAVDEWPFVFATPDRPPRELRCSGRAVTIAGRACAVWVLRDITEQNQLERQFLQAQKMEAVGKLAAGIAHDFNNLLTVILSYTSFALDDATLPEEHRAGLSQVLAAGKRAAALTRQLLVFSRRQISSPKALDFGITLSNLRDMLARLLPEHIKFECHCAENLPRVFADPANLEQIVMNLVVNARDAITRAGSIRVGLTAVSLTEDDRRRHPDARSGNFLCLTVADNGRGMDATVLSHIYEPFFTTKDVGQGTGLGLSTVYGIVRQHEGWIEVESTVNVGTTFSVFLPALTESGVRPATAQPFAPAGVPPLGRGERILLVEDEQSVRDTVRIVASRAGYNVTTAVDGPSALKAWAETAQPFDLLFTDMVMPNALTGTELALKLRALHPGLKVILSTGYSEELLKQGAHGLENARLLLKPYGSAKLLEILHETFAREKPDS
jgi:PAS domain S-box-containing protein